MTRREDRAEKSAKIRILYLMELLNRYSDEENPLTTNQIVQKLRELYGINVHRTTLPRDISILQEYGMDIVTVHSTQTKYFVGKRMFEEPELRLLIDAVEEFDPEAKQLTVDGEPVRLTSKELKILELFMRNPGRIFSAEEIYTRVWNEDAFAVENTVMVHIRHIREKIEINPREPKYLKVVWGVGYQLQNPAAGKGGKKP